MWLFSSTFVFALFSTPPNIGTDLIFIFTSDGTNISIPPNVLLAFITTSESIIAFLKSHLTPPNTAVKSAPVNFSPSKFTFCPANVAQYEFSPFLFSFNFPPFNLFFFFS